MSDEIVTLMCGIEFEGEEGDAFPQCGSDHDVGPRDPDEDPDEDEDSDDDDEDDEDDDDEDSDDEDEAEN